MDLNWNSERGPVNMDQELEPILPRKDERGENKLFGVDFGPGWPDDGGQDEEDEARARATVPVIADRDDEVKPTRWSDLMAEKKAIEAEIDAMLVEVLVEVPEDIAGYDERFMALAARLADAQGRLTDHRIASQGKRSRKLQGEGDDDGESGKTDGDTDRTGQRGPTAGTADRQ